MISFFEWFIYDLRCCKPHDAIYYLSPIFDNLELFYMLQ